MRDSVDPPRKIVKKKARHGGHHGGAWKVAYADFVTAMMALFIVLWIVGQSKAVKDAVAAYFTDPSAFSAGAASVLKGGAGVGAPVSPVAPKAPVAAPSGDVRNAKLHDSDREALEATATALREQIHHEGHLAGLEDKIKIELVDEGLRIQLVETNQGIFFDVGSAKIKPATHEILGIIGREVGKLPNDVGLEGHTDSRPYVGLPSYTNWELSADRANAARRILDASGLRPDQVASVVGYADRHLANRADPLDAANRRISIIVRFQKQAVKDVPRLVQLPSAKSGAAPTSR
jgi:chemotaxis protein MotB